MAVLAVSAFTLVGCANGEDTQVDSPTTQEPAPDTNSGDMSNDAEGCSVHLFDDDHFDESDDNFVLTEAGKYEDLSNLPGANKDWTDEADSIRVGADATVTIWADPNFQGQSVTLDPGSEHPSLDSEPSSLEMTC